MSIRWTAELASFKHRGPAVVALATERIKEPSAHKSTVAERISTLKAERPGAPMRPAIQQTTMPPRPRITNPGVLSPEFRRVLPLGGWHRLLHT